MNAFDKLLKSWWVILSFIFFINGLGFIYIGNKHNNRNWIIEGIAYEIPWFFYFIYFGIYGSPASVISNPTASMALFAVLIMFIGVIRSIWVAMKLWNVYDNMEKYSLNPTELNNPNKPKERSGDSGGSLCCLCIAVIFFMAAFAAIL